MKISTELINRSIEFVEAEASRIEGELAKLKVADDLMSFEYLSMAMILQLANNGILTRDDLAELDSEELVGFLKDEGIDDETVAGDIIMAARAHWFADEEASEVADDAQSDAE